MREIPPETQALVDWMKASRLEAARAHEDARQAAQDVVLTLSAAGLTVRDISSILRLSYQRVAQIKRDAAAKARKMTASADVQEGQAS